MHTTTVVITQPGPPGDAANELLASALARFFASAAPRLADAPDLRVYADVATASGDRDR
jgi:hypothetical protein